MRDFLDLNFFNIVKTDFADAYSNMWEAKKIVDMYVEDATRSFPEFKNLDEEKTKIVWHHLLRLKFFEKLKKALILERRDGGSVIFIGYNEDKNQKLDSLPNDSAEIEYIKVVESKNVSILPNIDNTLLLKNDNFDVLCLGVSQEPVSTERLIIFDGGFVNEGDWKSDSVLKPIISDIIIANKGRKSLAKLLNKSNCTLILDKGKIFDNDDKKEAALAKLAANLDNNNVAIISSPNIEVTDHTVSFGALPDIQMNNLKVLAAACNSPVSKFTGITNTGLNSTNAGDLENYYNVIAEYQKAMVIPKIYKMVFVILKKYCGMTEQDIENLMVVDGFRIEYPSLWNAKETEESALKTAAIDRVCKAINCGLMTLEQAAKDLNSKAIFDVEITPISEPDYTGNEDLLS